MKQYENHFLVIYLKCYFVSFYTIKAEALVYKKQTKTSAFYLCLVSDEPPHPHVSAEWNALPSIN